MAFDAFPANVRGPVVTNAQRIARKARIFTAPDPARDGEVRLFIAETKNNGKTASAVVSYPLPPSEPGLKSGRAGSRTGGSWGEWSWSSCGCSTSWGRTKQFDLIKQAKQSEDMPGPRVKT